MMNHPDGHRRLNDDPAGNVVFAGVSESEARGHGAELEDPQGRRQRGEQRLRDVRREPRAEELPAAVVLLGAGALREVVVALGAEVHVHLCCDELFFITR